MKALPGNPNEINMSMDTIMIARKAILEDLKCRRLAGDATVKPLKAENAFRWYKPQDNYYSGSGIVDCPVCKKGKLLYSRAEYNGHVHAACSNADCVRWME